MTMTNFYPPGWIEAQKRDTNELVSHESEKVSQEVTPEEDEAFERLLQLAGVSE